MYSQLAIYHLATVLPAFVIGAFLLLTVMGTARHTLALMPGRMLHGWLFD